MGKSYDVLERGLDWTNADGKPRREEPGATGVTDLLESDIPELLESGLIRETPADGGATQAKVAGRRAPRKKATKK
jgi:hypothetical protein